METLRATYSAEDLAWATDEVELRRDVYLSIELKERGKVVIRQETQDGRWPRVPIRRHGDTKEFRLRLSVAAESVRIRIYTTTEPKRIEYAYI